jgi:surface antigen
MAVGKLSMLLAVSTVQANDINNPKFFEYRSESFINEAITVSFGFFKTLDDDQKSAYHQALTHAVMFAENGQIVEWYRDGASGYARPVLTWPTGSGYCRRIHVQAIAHGVEKTLSQTACFDNAHTNWQWLKQ